MKKTINRRDFMKVNSLAGLGFLVPNDPLSTLYNLNLDGKNAVFPKDFLWGVAASAPQTESREGRGRSNWDVFMDNVGGSADGTNNMRNTEFEKRYLDEFKMLRDAGVKAFRFSFSWPRVQPETPGTPNVKAMSYYDKLIDAMLEHGLEPVPTLFHWDMPLWAGDFLKRDVSDKMQDYADIMSRLVGSRAKTWLAFNEPSVIAAFGYGKGTFAPGYHSKKTMGAAIHHINVSQAKIFEAVRSNVSAVKIASAFNIMPFEALSGKKEDIDAAHFIDVLWNQSFADPTYGLGYPDLIKPLVEPYIKDGDLEFIASKPDFYGVNFYSRTFVKADNDKHSILGTIPIAPPSELEKTQEFPYDPNTYTKILLDIHKKYGQPDILATEFGFAIEEDKPINGILNDPKRIKYIQGYIKAAQEAVKKGVKLKGMMYWSSTDNWEWTLGLSHHFGLIHIDKNTLERIPKKSLEYYGKCIKANAAADIR